MIVEKLSSSQLVLPYALSDNTSRTLLGQAVCILQCFSPTNAVDTQILAITLMNLKSGMCKQYFPSSWLGTTSLNELNRNVTVNLDMIKIRCKLRSTRIALQQTNSFWKHISRCAFPTIAGLSTLRFEMWVPN